MPTKEDSPLGLSVVTMGVVISAVVMFVYVVNPSYSGLTGHYWFMVGAICTLVGQFFVLLSDRLTSRKWVRWALLLGGVSLGMQYATGDSWFRQHWGGEVPEAWYHGIWVLKLGGYLCFLVYLRDLARHVPDDRIRAYVRSGTFWLLFDFAKSTLLMGVGFLAMLLDLEWAREFLALLNPKQLLALLENLDPRWVVWAAKVTAILSIVTFVLSRVSYVRLLLRLRRGLKEVPEEKGKAKP